jgi:hypothetical protein
MIANRLHLRILGLFCSLWLFPSLGAHAQYLDAFGEEGSKDYLKEVRKVLTPEQEKDFPEDEAMWLARTFSQLDRINIAPEIFIRHLRSVALKKNRFYVSISNQNYRDYLLALRIRYELTNRSNWQQVLAEHLEPLMATDKDPETAAQKVFGWLKERVELVGETRSYRFPYKGDQDPLTTLRARHGTEIDLAILGVAALRSVGIASRLVYAPTLSHEIGGKVWLEYRTEIAWKAWVPSAPISNGDHQKWLLENYAKNFTLIVANPPDPQNVTQLYLPTVAFWFCPTPLDTEHFEFGLLVKGQQHLQSIMGHDLYTPKPKDFDLGVAPANYLTVCGQRTIAIATEEVLLPNNAHYWLTFDFKKMVSESISASARPPFFEWTMTHFRKQTDDWNKY